EGGYVILPPSQGYEVIDATPPAELPEAWREIITRRPAPEAPTAPVDETVTPEELEAGDRYVASVLDGVVARLRKMQELAKPDPRDYVRAPWDQSANAECCTALELAHSPWNSFTAAAVMHLILDHAPRDRGFGEAQITEKWRSAVKTVGTKGRPKPKFHSGTSIFDDPDLQRPATAPAGGEGPPRVDPDQFFQKGEGLITDLLAQAVLDIGPLAIDDTANRGIWAYRAGVWAYAPHEVEDRVVVLLRGRFRPAHTSSVLPAVRKALLDRGAIITCDPLPDYVNTRSGMLNLRTGELEPHRPEFYSTVQLPVEWDPTAECPHFREFLSQVMAPDAIDFIWEVLGYLVLSGNPFQ